LGSFLAILKLKLKFGILKKVQIKKKSSKSEITRDKNFSTLWVDPSINRYQAVN